ncbi:hypothetical protein [Pseudonocardia alni]|uniref:TPR-repeat-containing protein n=1 Tax=Pseudonocardia alni subsp. carboxydivorans TaxID=415010 RepID=A0ABU9ALY6_PSEA5
MTGAPASDTAARVRETPPAEAADAPVTRDVPTDEAVGTGSTAPDGSRSGSGDRTDTPVTDARGAGTGADAVDRAGTAPSTTGSDGDTVDGPRTDRAERPIGRDERRPLRDHDDRGPRRERDDRGPRGGGDDRGPRSGRDDRRRDDRRRDDRGRNDRGRDDRRDRDARPRRAIPESAERTFVAEPDLPDSVTAAELDPSVRRDLRGLQKETAEVVARHLVAAGLLVDEDAVQALEHVRYARRRASRIAVVREAAGIVAYHAGEWNEALGEFRAARRMGGGPGHVHVMADIERALGRPERALDLARSPEARDLGHEERIELLIVAAGARRDLGEADAAVVGLQVPELDPVRRDPWSARLFYAYADNLLAAGRESEAAQWFVHAHDADQHRETDAAARIAELTGDELEGADDELSVGWEDVPPAADDDAEAPHTDAPAPSGRIDGDDHAGAVADPGADDASGADAPSADGTDTDGTDTDGTDTDGTDTDGTDTDGTDTDGTDTDGTDTDGTDEVRGDTDATDGGAVAEEQDASGAAPATDHRQGRDTGAGDR